MKIRAVADTHALIWYAFDDPRLSPAASAAMDDAAAAGERVAISSISLTEMVYLVEKGRVDPIAFERTLLLLDCDELFVEIPVGRAVAEAMRSVPRAQVPDLPDRVIAATAVLLGVPVVSRDGKIGASAVATIW